MAGLKSSVILVGGVFVLRGKNTGDDMKGLTPKQQAFADYYIQTGNATEAAVRAGYSAKTAGVIGDENLKKPYIKEYIDGKLTEMSEKRVATAQEVMETLTRVLRREERETVVVTVKTHKSWYDETGKKQILDTEEPQLVEIPPKLSDVNKAAELIGKRWGVWKDSIEITEAPKVVDDIE